MIYEYSHTRQNESRQRGGDIVMKYYVILVLYTCMRLKPELHTFLEETQPHYSKQGLVLNVLCDKAWFSKEEQ